MGSPDGARRPAPHLDTTAVVTPSIPCAEWRIASYSRRSARRIVLSERDELDEHAFLAHAEFLAEAPRGFVVVFDIGIEPAEALHPEEMVEQRPRGFERISLPNELRGDVPADRSRFVFVVLSGAAEQIADDPTGLLQTDRDEALVEGTSPDLDLRLGQVREREREEAGGRRRLQTGEEIRGIPFPERPQDQAFGFDDLHIRSSSNGALRMPRRRRAANVASKPFKGGLAFWGAHAIFHI